MNYTLVDIICLLETYCNINFSIFSYFFLSSSDILQYHFLEFSLFYFFFFFKEFPVLISVHFLKSFFVILIILCRSFLSLSLFSIVLFGSAQGFCWIIFHHYNNPFFFFKVVHLSSLRSKSFILFTAWTLVMLQKWMLWSFLPTATIMTLLKLRDFCVVSWQPLHTFGKNLKLILRKYQQWQIIHSCKTPVLLVSITSKTWSVSYSNIYT